MCCAQSLRKAQDNIRRARDDVEELLSHLDTARQVEAGILSGPRLNLAAFLKALARLEASTAFLSQHRRVIHSPCPCSWGTATRPDGRMRQKRLPSPCPCSRGRTGMRDVRMRA